MSIFTNPANAGVLGGFITGSLGRVQAGMEDPLRPWFGGVLTTPIGKDIKVFYGGAFNRFDPTLDKISLIRDFNINGQRATRIHNLVQSANGQVDSTTLDTTISTEEGTTVILPTLRGRIEGLIGVSYKDNIFTGFHFYQAGEDSSFLDSNQFDDKYLNDSFPNMNLTQKAFYRSLSVQNHLQKYDLGVTYKQKNLVAEAFGGLARYTLGGEYTSRNYTTADVTVMDPRPTTDTSETGTFVATEKSYNSFFGGARAFITFPMFAVDAVPSLYYERLRFNRFSQKNFSGGVGLLKAIDRGLFWGGMEIFQDQQDFIGDSTKTNFGFHISFGLEKSIGWDWLIVRVGGSRQWFNQKVEGANGVFFRNSWEENTDVDGTAQDLMGFGIGLNFEGRLKFDITLNEALPYFNPFGQGLKQSPNGSHMILQISSTFNL
jgi:hypothetical protein